jgi:putative nucleotidyltransferase with HDIG domain
MSASTLHISPDQLCVGLYIHLDLSWWEHDFAFSHFKIKDEGQIQALRALGLKQLRYDPARSDCPPLPLPTDTPPAAVAAPAPDPEEQARQARAAKLGALRKRLAEVDRTFIQASQRVKSLNQTLRSQPEEAIKQAGEVVRELVSALGGEGGAALHSINGKAAEDAYLHPLNVTVLSVMLGRQLGFDAEACHSLGLGALLHDIGKLQIPSKVLLKSEPLSRPEQQLLQLHCEFGVRHGQELMLDDEVLRIIQEHHEYCDGSGYPKGLREAAIGRLSRVVSLVNAFDDLCNPLDPRQALSPHEALALMFKQQRERYDEVALKTFIRCMGIYPPGSLVQLEDERYALVLGMHPSLPLRPTLIVYEPSIPKAEALIVNLEQEPKLAIARSLRTAQLPEEALEYLNPRQQLTYYVDPRQRGK